MNQIVHPERVLVRQHEQGDIITVDAVGEDIDRTMEPMSVKLPMEVALNCSEGKWHLERKLEGGGENVRSSAVVNVFIQLTPSKDIIVEGRRGTKIGWIFKKKVHERWGVKFTRLSS